MNDKSVGTDFRYAVEFSKIKRAPSKAFQPSPGQPDQRYPVRSAVSNRSSRSFSAPAARRAPPRPVWRGLGEGVAALASRAQLATRRTLRQALAWVKSLASLQPAFQPHSCDLGQGYFRC